MPTYNAAPYIIEAVESVLNQTFTDWELLIVDDCSTDDSVQLIEERYDGEQRVSLISLEQNQGAGIARNIAIDRAKGRYIAFLDSDDFWEAGKLQRQLRAFEETKARMVFSHYYVLNPGGLKPKQLVKAPEFLKFDDLLWGNPVGCLTAIYDTEKTGKIYMPELRMRQDWGCWLRLLKNGGHGHGVQEPLATLRLRKNSLSANKIRACYYNYLLLRSEAELSSWQAMRHSAVHGWAAVKRRHED